MDRCRMLAVGVLLGGMLANIAWGQGATATLYGRWDLDFKRTAAAMRAAGETDFPDEEDARMTIEFQSSGKLAIEYHALDADEDSVDAKRQGGWKVLSESVGKLGIELSIFDEDDTPETPRVEVRILDANTLHFDIEEEGSSRQILILTRQAA